MSENDPLAVLARLDDIEDLLGRITPGPWSDFAESGDHWIQPVGDDGMPRDGSWGIDANDLPVPDMLFIADAPAMVAQLVAAVRVLQESNNWQAERIRLLEKGCRCCRGTAYPPFDADQTTDDA